MATVSTLDFPASQPFVSTVSETPRRQPLPEVRVAAKPETAAKFVPSRCQSAPASRNLTEDLTAFAALAVAAAGGVFLTGMLAANFYASMIRFSPY